MSSNPGGKASFRQPIVELVEQHRKDDRAADDDLAIVLVDAKDHEEFQGYLAEKKAADARKKAAAPTKSRGVSRRTMFNVAVGTAVAAEAAVLGYNALGPTGGSVSDHGVRHAGANYTEAQRHNIVREVVDNRADIRGQSLGNWVALLPTKMGGGTYAIDLNSNRVLGSIWYWNYGDYNPISHHLCAFPSADPLHGFEFGHIGER